ncbi:hypothetical protein Bca52824_073558 [Brassica carinata]|uniref:Uncharacterized protein n=1 Tax=Brassica carinata TaxID=52824 RepID=A0A8X7QA80_BRACI|nr:hypothetical protein Bca52824_073558 [Brassica carinata]
MAFLNTVSELKPFKSMWKIKVKIIRLWRQYSAQGGATIEMVLSDSNGDNTHATVKKELVEQFAPVLGEGMTRILINFTLNHSCGSYRTTSHPYKIGFIETTRVRRCDDFPYALSGFKSANFEDILNGCLNPDYLVDVLGQIVEVSHVEVVSVNGKDTQKISLELQNLEDVRLPIFLWGSFAMDVNEAVQTKGDESIICVLRFGKIKIWKGKLRNVYIYDKPEKRVFIKTKYSSKLYLLIVRLPEDSIVLAIVESKALALANGVSQKEHFFVHTPRRTISYLLESKQVEQEIVLCTIAAIDCDMGWYYLSCKVCAKKVLTFPNENLDDGEDEDGGGHSYYCAKCKVYNPKLLPRYKLHIVVLDSTGNAKFLLFDNIAFHLIHTPCLELTRLNIDEIQDPENLPLAITNLIGKTYLFKIGIEKENFVYKHDTFKVLKIITNQDMISEFDVVNSPTDTSSFVTPESSLLSDAPEGSLMLTNSVSEETQTTAITPAKRRGGPVINLEESFDQNSVTKTPCTIRIKKEKNEKKVAK